jgi:hypothetical protein
MRALLLFAVLTFVQTTPLYASVQTSCSTILSHSSGHQQVDDVLPNDLTNYYHDEIRRLSEIQIAGLNAQSLEEIQFLKPPLIKNRAQTIPIAELEKILKVLQGPKYFANANKGSYSQPGPNSEIGYCFGRAAYVHQMLLKLGLQNESIRKVWILGPTRVAGSTMQWQFHVATAAFTAEKGWVTIDSDEVAIETIQDWYKSQLSASVDNRARIYVTSPDKFSVDLGRYDRVQMGLDVEKEDDWYRHYFVDMLKSLQQTPIEDLGLQLLPLHQGANAPASRTMAVPLSVAPATHVAPAPVAPVPARGGIRHFFGI